MSKEEEDDGVLFQDPTEILDPRERARVLFIQWHMDEVTSVEEAAEYADRLLERMQEAGLVLMISTMNPNQL